MDVNDKRSTCSMAFYNNENLVTWVYQKQQCLVLSSCETEFMAATIATCQAMWIPCLLAKITGTTSSTCSLVRWWQVIFRPHENTSIPGFTLLESVWKIEKVTHVFNKEQRADILRKAMTLVKHKEILELIVVKNVTNFGLWGGEYCHNPNFTACFIYLTFYDLFNQV